MKLEAWCVLTALIVLALSIIFTTHENDVCKAKGGVLVRGTIGYVCIIGVSK